MFQGETSQSPRRSDIFLRVEEFLELHCKQAIASTTVSPVHVQQILLDNVTIAANSKTTKPVANWQSVRPRLGRKLHDHSFV